MSNTGYLMNGDQVMIKFGPGYMFYDPNYQIKGEGSYPFSQNDALFFNIIKMNWSGPGSDCGSGHNCGTLSPANAGDQIYYGDLIELYTYTNTAGKTSFVGYLATSCQGSAANDHQHLIMSSYGSNGTQAGNYTAMSINNCPLATNNKSDGNFTMCGSNDVRSCGIWGLVSFTGVGYMSDSHKQNFGPANQANNPNPNVTKTPVMYQDIIYLQSIFDQNCDTGNIFNIGNSADVYLYCNTDDQGVNSKLTAISTNYYGYAICDTMGIGVDFPGQSEHHGYALNFVRVCTYDKVCGGSCAGYKIPAKSQIKSGDEICIYSTYNGLQVSNINNYDVGFNPTNEYYPGDVKVTFVIKKLMMNSSQFYSNSDPEAVIGLGEPFCIFGRDKKGDVGLVYTDDFGNGVILKTDSTQWNKDNGCGNDGFFYSTWVFVSIDGKCTRKLF